MALGRDRAREVAMQELARFAVTGDVVLIEDSTEEVPEGWFFFWNSRKYLQTGDISEALAGGGPIFVSRADGATEMVWSGERWTDALARYRATGSMKPTWAR